MVITRTSRVSSHRKRRRPVVWEDTDPADEEFVSRQELEVDSEDEGLYQMGDGSEGEVGHEELDRAGLEIGVGAEDLEGEQLWELNEGDEDVGRTDSVTAGSLQGLCFTNYSSWKAILTLYYSCRAGSWHRGP